jgi:hypothetical protein
MKSNYYPTILLLERRIGRSESWVALDEVRYWRGIWVQVLLAALMNTDGSRKYCWRGILRHR